MGENPSNCRWYHSWAGGPQVCKKQAEQATSSLFTSKQHPSTVCISSCLRDPALTSLTDGLCGDVEAKYFLSSLLFITSTENTQELLKQAVFSISGDGEHCGVRNGSAFSCGAGMQSAWPGGCVLESPS